MNTNKSFWKCLPGANLHQITHELAGKDVVAVFDGWTDRFSKQSYLGVVVRFVDMNAKCIRQRVIAIRPLPHPHTHSVIREFILAVLQEYNVDEKQVVIFRSFLLRYFTTAADQTRRGQCLKYTREFWRCRCNRV